MYFAVHLIRPPATFSPSDAEQEFAFLCGKPFWRLARHCGFTAAELDFILNYDIQYHLGRDAGEKE